MAAQFKLAEALVEVGLDDSRLMRGLNTSHTKAMQEVRKLQTEFTGAQSSAGNFGGALTMLGGPAGIAAGAVATVTAGVAALASSFAAVAAKGVMLSAAYETQAIALGVMLGSAEKARALLADLTGFAASTPFETDELTRATKGLTAYGVASEQIIPTLRALGDIASGLGIPLVELADIYGRARVQQTLFTQDIKELQGRGIPIVQELAQQMGVTSSRIMEMASEGKIGFRDLQTAIIGLTSEGGRFHGMTEQQSQSLAGLWSTMADTMTLAMRDVGDALVEELDIKAIEGDMIAFGEFIRSDITPGIRDLVAVMREVGWAAGAIFGVDNPIKDSINAFRTAQVVVTEYIRTHVTGARMIAEAWARLPEFLGGGKAMGENADFLKALEEELNAKIAAINERIAGGGAAAAKPAGQMKVDAADEAAAEANRARAVSEGVASLREQVEAMKLSREENELRKLAMKGATDEELASVRALQQQRTELEESAKAAENYRRVQQQMADLVRDWQSEAKQFGLTGRDRILSQLAAENADPATVEKLRALDAELDRKEALRNETEQLARAEERRKTIAESIHRQMMTPAERYRDRLREIQELLDKGHLDEETARRARRAAAADFGRDAGPKWSMGDLPSIHRKIQELAFGPDGKPEVKHLEEIAERNKKANEIAEKQLQQLKKLVERPGFTFGPN